MGRVERVGAGIAAISAQRRRIDGGLRVGVMGLVEGAGPEASCGVLCERQGGRWTAHQTAMEGETLLPLRWVCNDHPRKESASSPVSCFNIFIDLNESKELLLYFYLVSVHQHLRNFRHILCSFRLQLLASVRLVSTTPDQSLNQLFCYPPFFPLF